MNRSPGRLPIVTGTAGVSWPVVPTARAAGVLGLLFQLERSQWWTSEALERHQLDQLASVAAHAAATVPFYGPRFRSSGWSPGETLTPERWRRLPVLARAELQDAGDTILSQAVPTGHGRQSALVTSGSTGRPVRTVGTEVTQLFWAALTLRDHLWHARDFGRKLAVVRQFPLATTPPPEGTTSPNWGPATAGVLRTGPCALLGIDRTVREQTAWLEQERPAYLLTYPSNVVALAGHFTDRGAGLEGLCEIRTFGEVLEPRAREACRRAWNVPLVDVYSTQEVGYIALQCPDHEHYHVQSESVLVEVVDDEDRPCRPGEVGRVVVTTLHNLVMPLLRYDVGDFAEVGEPCPCGRGLPVIARVLGRQRNLLTLPGGDRVWPVFRDPSELAAPAGVSLPPFQQFQVVQRSLERLELRLVTPRPLRDDEEEVVRGYLATTLGHPFEVTISYLDEIPRSQGGKFEDFRSELGA